MSRVITVFVSIVLLSFLSTSLFAQASYDTLSIYDLQWVADPATDDLSPSLGDTVVLKGLVLHGPRDLWVGNRWAVHVVDPDSGNTPWNGFFIIQNDTFEVNTLFNAIDAGYICYFTGVVAEFENYSQIALLTNPPVAVDILSTENPIPEPVTVTAADLLTRTTGEQYESMWVNVDNLTIVNNDLPGDFASWTDATGELSYFGDYFNWIRDGLDNGTYTWPPAGTRVNAKGFVRDEAADVGTGYNLNPRSDQDLEILTIPPVIDDNTIVRNPGVPTSADAVVVNVDITDDGTVDSAAVIYSVDGAPFETIGMSNEGSDYNGIIPAQANGAFVRYFIFAEDDEGFGVTLPGDTSNAVYSYVVRDEGLSIYDLQFTHGYSDDESPYSGYEVTVEGVVTTDSSDFLGDYYIQEADTTWSGILVDDGAHFFDAGDWVSVTGLVEERFGVTRITDVTAASLITSDVVFAPAVVTTGELNSQGGTGEDWESVLIRIENLTVTDDFPDSGPFGEFVVDDGSGGVRIDDDSDAFDGNRSQIVYANNDQIGALVGMGYYSFGNYKILPRDTADVFDHVVSGLEDLPEQLPGQFVLDQNYPNPFNPVTTIRYTIAEPGLYTLSVYNVLGQRVARLFEKTFQSGTYTAQWRGLDDSGTQLGSGIYFYTLDGEGIRLTKKMIFIK